MLALALAVGRDAGANSGDVYVSDAHNGRLVQLHDDGNGLAADGTRATSG